MIRCSLSRLPARDRVFLRLHFQSGLTVAEAARAQGADQKALYRKKEDILKRLRADLEAEGIGLEEAQVLLAELDWEAVLSPDKDEPDKDEPSRSLNKPGRVRLRGLETSAGQEGFDR